MASVDNIEIAYVSLMVPDAPEFRNEALHRNGNTFMQNVFFGLRRVPAAGVTSFSAIPIPSFPHSRRLFVWSRTLEIVRDAVTRSVAFLNITPIKQLTIGLAMFWRLLSWGMARRNNSRKAVFSYNISVPPLLFSLAAARLLGAKVLLFLGDINIPGQTVPDTLLYRVDARIQTWLLKYVAAGIVVSERISTDFLPGRPYIRLDGGASQALIENTGRSLRPAREDAPTFTIVATGYLSEFNGYREIISAFSQMRGAHYRLIVAGGGPLEELVAQGAALDPRIQFKGFVEYDSLLALHAEADVLVSMRLTEKMNTAYAFPSKTFEYLLSGVPVVTTGSGHMATEYGPYCFILEEETAAALASKLTWIERLGAAERTRRAALARNYIVEHKTWDAQQVRIADFVQDVMAMRN